ALELTLQQRMDLPTEQVALLQSGGRTLAADVFADRDQPPFDRVMMDGIAIASDSFQNGQRDFRIEGVQAAGREQLRLQNAEAACMEVMTGAMLPRNTDTVIPYEHCDIFDGMARVKDYAVSPGKNIHKRSSDGKAGDLLLKNGTHITATAIATLASVGYGQVPVIKLPRVAVCSTGDELMDINEQPAVHQIRRSNSYMLAAALADENINAGMHHLADDEKLLGSAISSLKKDHDVLIFSGAVSKGKFDFLPDVLRLLGMRVIFHNVAQKPGKPFLLGKFPDGPLVFGFPGNPVSTFVCYQIYFKSWLSASLKKDLQKEHAVFDTDLDLKTTLAQHLLVSLRNDDGVLKAAPVAYNNSGDLVNLAYANGLALFPAEKSEVKKGEVVQIIWF
ncbi:MAG: molybdopterin molybdotransferase MoeA, partial [Mucilaginibacter polytrichastri]|nr:molybdopterin molybdotransferase MoeA [Mucilaginibacter polytrichastri]